MAGCQYTTLCSPIKMIFAWLVPIPCSFTIVTYFLLKIPFFIIT